MALQQVGSEKLRICLWFLLAALVISSATGEAHAGKTVVIDPGHGGHDNGAKWGGIAEKNLCLDVAKRVEALLKKRGIATAMTRRSDVFVSLKGRSAIANRYRNALFVSIHFNANSDRRITGIETFYLSSRGAKLAGSIQRRLAGRIHTTNRGIKKRHYSVIRKTRGVAVLVECGFISNTWERNRCASAWYRNILAQEIANGIAAHLAYYK